MAHPEQRQFFERVKHMHPWSFKDMHALDCGSLDVNGSLRDLFTGGTYTGVDVVPGRNVDIVARVDQFGLPDIYHHAVSCHCGTCRDKDGRQYPVVSSMLRAAPMQYDTIVSAEMLEHDPHWRESLKRMYELLKPHGLLVISCAGPGRPEHGTRRTGEVWTSPDNPDYYRNISVEDIAEAFELKLHTGVHQGGAWFKWWELKGRETWPQDTYFWGMKAGG